MRQPAQALFLLSSLALAASSALAWHKCDAHLASNPGFELPAVPSGMSTYDVAPEGWQAAGGPPPSLWLLRSKGIYPVEGAQAVFLGDRSEMSRDVDVTGGSAVAWTFAYMGVNGGGQIEVLVDGQVASTVIVGQSRGSWEAESGGYEISAGATSVKVTVRNARAARGGGVLLDSFRMGAIKVSVEATDIPQVSVGELVSITTTVQHTGPAIADLRLSDVVSSELRCIKETISILKGPKTASKFAYCKSNGPELPPVATLDCDEVYQVQYGVEATRAGTFTHEAAVNFHVGRKTISVRGRTQQIVVVEAKQPTPDPSNLLADGGFETPRINGLPQADVLSAWKSPRRPKVVFVSSGRERVEAASGSQYAQIIVGDSMYQDVAVPAGSTLQWSLKHRGHKRSNKFAVNIGPTNAPTRQFDAEGGADKWTSYSGTYVVPQGLSTIRFEIASASYASDGLIDDVVLSTVGGLAPTSGPAPTPFVPTQQPGCYCPCMEKFMI